MSNCAAPRCAMRLSIRSLWISVCLHLLLVIFQLVLPLLLPAMQLLLQSLRILMRLRMQRTGAHQFQVHAGASQRMLNHCWRIRLFPSALGRMKLTTSTVLRYPRPCSILVCHDIMPCFTEPDCCTIPYHLTSHYLCFYCSRYDFKA